MINSTFECMNSADASGSLSPRSHMTVLVGNERTIVIKIIKVGHHNPTISIRINSISSQLATPIRLSPVCCSCKINSFFVRLLPDTSNLKRKKTCLGKSDRDWSIYGPGLIGSLVHWRSRGIHARPMSSCSLGADARTVGIDLSTYEHSSVTNGVFPKTRSNA